MMLSIHTALKQREQAVEHQKNELLARLACKLRIFFKNFDTLNGVFPTMSDTLSIKLHETGFNLIRNQMMSSIP